MLDVMKAIQVTHLKAVVKNELMIVKARPVKYLLLFWRSIIHPSLKSHKSYEIPTWIQHNTYYYL